MDEAMLDALRLRRWIEWRATRAPGPGGQNVNKVSTAVTILFDLAACTLLSDVEKRRVGHRLRTRLSRDGRLRVVSRVHRTQARNRAAAEDRLIMLLADAIRERKPRRKTKPTRGSQVRRLTTKRQRGETKRMRGEGRSARGDTD